jgi:pimeloyl-ACP methyl ester carboxylesterase
VDYILRECKERGETGVTLMGNSIGGFTVASVAAELSVLKDAGKSNVQCDGLVLMNSAGVCSGSSKNQPFYTPWICYF